jgi:DNA-binding FadR family transcriptional regulator
MTDAGLQIAAGESAPERLSDVVYDGIVSLIARGDLILNSRLPSETELATRFAVSRPVVREALGRLREDGVVVSRQGSGSYVKRQPDVAVLRFAEVASLADVQRCFEFRAGHEAAAAALAAERWQEEDLQRIAVALEDLERCLNTGNIGIDEDRRFHEAIALATRNHYYISIQVSLASHITAGMNVTRQLSLLRKPASLRSVQKEHDAIFEAIRQRDQDVARDAMQRHILNARQRMFEGI